MSATEKIQLDTAPLPQDARVRFDDGCIRIRPFLRWLSIPYGDLCHAFLRVEEAVAGMCCGRADFSAVYLVLRNRRPLVSMPQTPPIPYDEEYKVGLSSFPRGEDILAHIARKAPTAKIGI
ncbi:MAG: hypothetical protein LBR77_04445 [Lachnospiraceae bacterium]|jgi:hypothetical protein|nr:hypothetical protein [Lachnospiraceae bacterium]